MTNTANKIGFGKRYMGITREFTPGIVQNMRADVSE